MTTRRRQLVLVASVLLVIEASSSLALHFLATRRDLRYRTFAELIDPWRDAMREMIAAEGSWYQRIDRDLGWVTIPGARARFTAVNQAGVRANREYAAVPPPGVVRIAAFGDSFVHGDEVTTEEAWTTRLERTRPDLEVLNYGVGGYGIDQALLRYEREGRRLAPHVVLLGIITDDVLRGVNVYRPFFAPKTRQVLAKPRFVVGADGDLVLVPNPLPDAGAYRAFLDDPGPALQVIARHDDYAPPASAAGPLDVLATVRLVKLLRATLAQSGEGRRSIRHGELDVAAEPVRLARATVHEFVARVRAAGAEPLVVFFPDRTELDARRDGRAITYRPLRDLLVADGVPVVDLLDGFDALAPGWTTRRIMRRSHYSPRGNRLVASWLAAELERRGLVPPAAHLVAPAAG